MPSYFPGNEVHHERTIFMGASDPRARATTISYAVPTDDLVASMDVLWMNRPSTDCLAAEPTTTTQHLCCI